MPLTVIYAGYLLAHAALMRFSFTFASAPLRIWILRALLAGVLYDNSALLLNTLYGAADWLKAWSYPRWWIHGTVLPLLSIYMFSLLRHLQLPAIRQLWVEVLFLLVTLSCLAYGIWYEILMLELSSKTVGMSDHLFGVMERFASVSKTPPLGTIFTNLFLMIWAGYLWRKTGWYWLFAGALFIFIINAASVAFTYGFLLGNFAEVVFIAALLHTEKRFYSAP